MSETNLPVVERIVQDVIAKLGTVSLPAYHCDLTVERPTPKATNWTHGKTVVYVGQRAPDEDMPQQYEQYFQTIAVVTYAIVPSESDESLDEKLQIMAADIHKALTATQSSRERDGWALDTIPGEVTPLERDFDSNEGGIMLEFTVRFRHTWGNSFESPHRT